MKTTLTLLIAATALTAAIGAPVWSVIDVPPDDGTSGSFATVVDNMRDALPFILVSDDDDDDDEDDACISNARNPAPVGTVAPPQIGLFGNGAAPQAQMPAATQFLKR
ncbi:hypothetical protein [Yoonia sp.]|uniref:hypothetical protein n=1 Tax=Yoonia sp. TaxID=2212373 RepID=UPI0025E058BF|nr:hypothetical protein [Yoonia sp.]